MKRFYRNGRRTDGSGEGSSDEVWKPFSDLWSIIGYIIIIGTAFAKWYLVTMKS